MPAKTKSKTSVKSTESKLLPKTLKFLRSSLTVLNALAVVVLFLVIVAYFFRDRMDYPRYRYDGVARSEVGYAPPSPSKVMNASDSDNVQLDASTGGRYKIYNGYISTVVKDINKYSTDIKNYVRGVGGYIVNEYVQESKPSVIQYKATDRVYSLSMVVRVPRVKLQDFMKYLKDNAQEVVSININGYDVTDEYEDLAKKLNLYETTYNKLEEIYNKATDPDDLLKIQNRLLQVQRDIDRIKGRIQAIEKQSKFARVSISATTDKYSLSYTPKNIWDIETTTKLAVRSLLTTFSNIVKLLIWVGVFTPLWLPVVLVVVWGIKKIKA